MTAAGVPAVSTFSTGGAGDVFQKNVYGWLLAQLLMGASLAGIPGAFERVGFQRRNNGAFLDDAVVTVADDLNVELSIKLGVAVVPSDDDLIETLGAAWRLHRTNQRSWAGLVAPPEASGFSALKRLVAEAQIHSNLANFLTATSTPGAIDRDDRKRFATCRTILNNVKGSVINDQEFHDFLRRFTVLGLDVAMAPHSDVESIVTILAALRGLSREKARALFVGLADVGADLAMHGGEVDRAELLEHLINRGVVAGIAADLRLASQALQGYAVRTFESRNDQVAGIQLDRVAFVDDVLRGLGEGKVVVINGPSGYGKSTVARAAYETLSASAPVLHVSGRRVESAGSWPTLADDIGIPRDRAKLFELLETNPAGPTVVIDALEHVLSDGGRALVRDLLRGLGERGSVRLVLAMRDSVVGDVLSWLGETAVGVASVDIKTLSDDEVAQLTAASPALGLLVERLGPENIPGGLLMLRLLNDARISDEELAQVVPSEAELLDLWWRHFLAGDDPSVRHDRLTITLGAAQAVVDAPAGLFQLPGGSNGRVVGDLERDGVLLLDLDAGDRYRFGHDLVQDWAVVRWLENDPGLLSQRLSLVMQGPGFYHSVTLLAQRLAERDPRCFDELLEGIGDARSEHAFLSALAVSPRARQLLEAHAGPLLVDRAARLAALLTVVATEQVDIEPAHVDLFLRNAGDVGTAKALAAIAAPPRVGTWAPLIEFCLRHAEDLGRAYLPFLKVAEKWQRVVPHDFPFRKGILRVAMLVLGQLEAWRPHEPGEQAIQILHRDADEAEKAARSIVAHSGDVDPAQIAAYLDDLSTNGWGPAQDDMLKQLGPLGTALPAETVEFALSRLVEPERHSWEMDFSELGLRKLLYYPASDLQGPFLAMLHENEAAGLDLVRQVARRAAARRHRETARRFRSRARQLTFEFRGRAISLTGDERAYVAFRPGSQESSVLTSALMALETWALQQMAVGRDVVEVADLLLSDTDNVAFLGIAIGLGYDYPALVPELVDVVSRPWLWRFEDARRRVDSQPDTNAFMPAEFLFPPLRPDIDRRNRERDRGREQNRLVQTFAVRYLFCDGEELRSRFQSRVGLMTVADACLWEEEAANAQSSDVARELFERFRSATNAADYADLGGGRIEWQPPGSLLPTPEEARMQELTSVMIGADLRLAKALREYSGSPNLRAFEALGEMVERELVAGNFSGDMEAYARHAVVRCAAAAVTFLPWSNEEPSEWSVRIVREAAVAEDARSWDPSEDDEDALDIRASIATAIAALLTVRGDDADLRSLVFRAAGRVRPKLGASLLRGLSPAWTSRPETAANVLYLLAHGARRDEDAAPLPAEQIDVFLRADGEHKVGPIPDLRVVDDMVAYRLNAALPEIRDRLDNPVAAAMLMPLAEQLVAALREADEDESTFKMELGGEVARLCAKLFVASPAGHNAFHRAVLDWKASPEFYATVVNSLVRTCIAYVEVPDKDLERFEQAAQPFLEADHRASLKRQHLDRGFRDACWALMMVEDVTGLIVTAAWPHAARFTAYVERWVLSVGGHPVTAHALVNFLERFEAAFSGLKIVGWLSACAAATAEPLRDAFWRTNGNGIAALVLRLQAGRPLEFRATDLRNAASALADQLIAAGIAGAGDIRRDLETRGGA